jgi:autotransporter adhesin
MGHNASSTGDNAIAIGTNAKATGSVAVGNAALASNGGAAFGDLSTATGTNSAAFGTGAKATAANSAAIGSNSIADVENTVSVGSAGHERRIANVAAGVNTTDAVNVGQLNAGLASTLAQANSYTDNQFKKLDRKSSGGTAAALAVGGIPQAFTQGHALSAWVWEAGTANPAWRWVDRCCSTIITPR